MPECELAGFGERGQGIGIREERVVLKSGPGRRKLAAVLGLVFLFAMLMGPGPGLYLVNPDPADPNARFFFFGMPVVYVWAVFWFFVQAAVVVIAYVRLWDDRNEAA